MGARGPLRKPGSRRWNREVRKRQRLAADAGQTVAPPAAATAEQRPAELPVCPKELSREVAERWLNLVVDMVSAGITVKQVDARAIAIAARYEDSIAKLDELCSRPDLEPETLHAALRTRLSSMKEYLAALRDIGGTPLVRMRAKIAPEEKSLKVTDDPWGSL